MAYLVVKRAQWADDVRGETQSYVNGGGGGDRIGFWNGVAMQTQRDIIDGEVCVEEVGVEPLGEWCIGPTIAEKVIASAPDHKNVTYNTDGGGITIPVAAYNNKPKDILTMKSFTGGGGAQ